MCSCNKKQPKVQEKKKSFDYNAKKCTCPFVLQRVWPPFEACSLASATFPNASCSWPDSGTPAKWTQSGLPESTFCRLFPNDHSTAPRYYSDKPCNSSTPSSNVVFQVRLSSHRSKVRYVGEKHYVNYNTAGKCWLIVYEHLAYSTTHYPKSSWIVIKIQLLPSPTPPWGCTISQRPGPSSLTSMDSPIAFCYKMKTSFKGNFSKNSLGPTRANFGSIHSLCHYLSSTR